MKINGGIEMNEVAAIPPEFTKKYPVLYENTS